MFANFYFEENLIYDCVALDKFARMIYNVFTMKNQIVPNQIVQEADNLSKETGISFRDCLEVLYKAHQELRYTEKCPKHEVCVFSSWAVARTPLG